jgi:hypothetical protein
MEARKEAKRALGVADKVPRRPRDNQDPGHRDYPELWQDWVLQAACKENRQWKLGRRMGLWSLLQSALSWEQGRGHCRDTEPSVLFWEGMWIPPQRLDWRLVSGPSWQNKEPGNVSPKTGGRKGLVGRSWNQVSSTHLPTKGKLGQHLD